MLTRVTGLGYVDDQITAYQQCLESISCQYNVKLRHSCRDAKLPDSIAGRIVMR